MFNSRRELKQDAVNKIRSAAVSPYPTTIVFLLISLAHSGLGYYCNRNADTHLVSLIENVKIEIPQRLSVYCPLILFAIGMLLSVIYVGYAWFALRISRSQRSSLSNMFDTFNMPLKVIGLTLVTEILVVLWSLLFIIPGIVALYRYRMAIYILHDHPEYGIMQCIRESKSLMTGHKGELFVLDLSFLGWAILNALTLSILAIWTMPYFYVTYANFYNARLAENGQYGGPRQNP